MSDPFRKSNQGLKSGSELKKQNIKNLFEASIRTGEPFRKFSKVQVQVQKSASSIKVRKNVPVRLGLRTYVPVQVLKKVQVRTDEFSSETEIGPSL